MRTSRELVIGILLYAACAAFMLGHARTLTRPETAPRELIGWAALALLPALVVALRPRPPWWAFPALAGGVLILTIGNQTGHWPFAPHLLGHTGYIARVWDDLSEGTRSWLTVTVPYDPTVDPEVRSFVTVVLVLLMMVVAGAILVWREPLVAILATFVPFAVVSTVFHLERPLLRSALMLGLALLLMGCLDRRRARRARPGLVTALGATIIVVGLVVAAAPGVAKGAFLPWRTWAPPGGVGVNVGYVWDQTYGPLVRPKQKTEVLRVRSPVKGYWRATVLEDFNGIGWVADPHEVAVDSSGDVDVPADQISEAVSNAKPSASYQVRVTNVALDEPLLVTTGQTVSVSGLSKRAGAVSISDDGVLRPERTPPLRSSYTVNTVQLDPTPEQLNATGTDYPDAVVGRDLALIQGTNFPAFGTPDRDRLVEATLARAFYDPKLVDWLRVYRQARQITADASTPYEATIALESYFQTNYHYDEKADYSRAADGPLPAFFLGSGKNGYCQMFSGSMAVILRLLGIPARVAEGFTPGKLDPRSKRFVVTDRDAHAWVEVYFPGYGWLPFEPTPTKRLDVSFSGTSSGFDAAAQAAAAGSALLSELLKNRGTLGQIGGGRTPEAADARPGGPGGPGTGIPSAAVPQAKGWRPGPVTYVVLLVAGLLALLLLIKRLRAIRAYVARDPHRIAAAVRSDLAAWVVDQGIRDGGRSLTPHEFGAMLKREFAVDASAWATQLTRARYGPEGPGAEAAATAARSESRLIKKRIRDSLTPLERARGLFDLRSLLP